MKNINLFKESIFSNSEKSIKNECPEQVNKIFYFQTHTHTDKNGSKTVVSF